MYKFNKIYVIYLPILLLLFFSIVAKTNAQDSSIPSKSIMVLHGEWQLWKWGKPFDSTFFDEISNQKDLDVRISFEFMGLEFVDDGAYPKEAIDHLKYKTAKNPVDLVVALLPRANYFLSTYGHEIFPGVPKIFVLPAQPDLNSINALSDAVAIPSSSESALKKNIEQIYSILPKTQELAVICGSSLHDISYLKTTKTAINEFDRKIKTTFFIGEPLAELLPKVSNLPKNSAILFLTYGQDLNKKKIVSAVAVSQISKKANAPVFSFYDSLLGRGIVGGNLTSAEKYAQKTAEIGLQLLRGESISSIEPVKDTTINQYDWRQLKRWDIPETHLPSGAVISYKKISLWETYKTQIIIVLLFICLQTILIFVLVITLRQHSKIENDLRESEKNLQDYREHLEALVEKRTTKIKKTHNLLLKSKELLDSTGKIANVGGWELDARTLEVKWTDQTFRIYGLELSNQPSLDEAITYFHEDDQERLSTAVQKALDHGEPYDMEVRLITAKGEKLWTRTVCNPQIIDGKVTTLKGTFQDITKRKQMEEALKESRENLHSLLQNIQAGVVVHGPDTKIKDFNKLSLELLGLTENQMLEKESFDPSWKFFNDAGEVMAREDYPANKVISTKTELKNMIAGVYRPAKNDVIKVLINAVPQFDSTGNLIAVIVTFMDNTKRIAAEEARENLLKSLQEALDSIKTLSGLVPICSKCKKIRDDKGYWSQIEAHIQKHTYAKFSHGICPECSDDLYGEEDWYIKMKKQKDNPSN